MVIVKVQDDADVLLLDMWHGLGTGYMQIHTAPVSAAEKEQPSMGAPLPACSVPLLERGDKLHVTWNLWSKGVNVIS